MPATNTTIVIGSGQVAEELAAALQGELTEPPPMPEAAPTEASDQLGLLVYVCPCATEPQPLIDMSTQDWAQSCEAVLEGAIASLKTHHAALKAAQGQVVFVIPSFTMPGANGFAAVAAAGEGLRILAKSTAKQWGFDGIQVNTVALDPTHFIPGELGKQISNTMGIAELSGFGHPGSIAEHIVPTINMLQNQNDHFITGATLIMDGGVWMAN